MPHSSQLCPSCCPDEKGLHPEDLGPALPLYNIGLPTLALVLLGGALPLASSYGLGILLLRKTPVPRVMALGVGAAVLSLAVFFLLVARIAGPPALGAVLLPGLISLCWVRRPPFAEPAAESASRVSCWISGAVIGAYSVLYLIHALAPEVQPDAYTYHLGLVAEYLRLGAFPRRVGFFEVMPQGLEMLFVPAFAIGKHSAAKLVHFAFLAATVPLVVLIGRRLRLSDTAALVAAGLYFCAPVAGVSGTAAYNDAALVFFTLAVFFALLLWDSTGRDRYLAVAGVLAGFCYAVKLTGLLVIPLAMLFVLIRRRPRAAVMAAMCAFPFIAAWMIRSAAMSGNPLAPMFNRWFPNRHFHIYAEQALSHYWHTYGGFEWIRAGWDLTVGGRLQGVFGPAFLLLPLGLLAVKKRAGRLLLAAAVLLALPWLSNVGARFLLPSAALAAIALAMVLPRRTALACLLFQAVACLPWVMDRWEPRVIWRLDGLPWRAALRLESDSEYLRRVLWDYRLAEMLERNTAPGDRILGLMATPTSYMNRPVVEYWQHALGQQLADTVKVAAFHDRVAFFDVRGDWPLKRLRALRFRLRESYPTEWCIHEVHLYAGEARVRPSAAWQVGANPNKWEAPLALDGNIATRWRTWENMRPGMLFEVHFEAPLELTGAVLLSHTPVTRVPIEFAGLGEDGAWQILTPSAPAYGRTPEDLRPAAAAALRRNSIRFLLVPNTPDGLGPLGRLIEGHEREWGLREAARLDPAVLYRVSDVARASPINRP